MKQMTLKKGAVFFLVFFSAACIVGTGFAGDTEKGAGGKVNIWTKDHHIDIGASDRPPDRYELHDGGIIDRIDMRAKEIVVNDALYTLADDVVLKKENGRRAFPSDFKERELVGFNLDPKKEKTIVLMYLLEKDKKPTE